VAPAPTPAAPGAEAEFSRPWQDAFGSSPGSAPDHYGRTEQTGSEPTHHQQPLTVGTDYRTAHQFATGAGVRVAVIDTGVFNHEQLHVEPVADLVSPAENNPLLDCDGHGTIVAGIIGAEQSGVAPNAQILSIRQSSAHYSSRQPNNTPDHQHAPDAEEPELTGTLSSFAQAIHTALDHDAQVINASVVSCIPPEHAEHLHTQALDDALARAEHQQVPVVAAAGNAGQGCERGSIVFPGNNETVVTVGALATPHEHAEYSMPQLGHPTGAGDGDGGDARDDGDAAYNSGGPNDVALSAPGRVSVGLSPNSQAWASGIIRNGQPSGLHGTSFAAPVVTGTVALLRERYPHASAAEIRELLVTASYPQHGFIDPVRGLTPPPRPVPGPTRVGGFGGIDGLKEFLTDNEVKVMVDASHPFAAAMHGHAAQACRDLNLPLARLAPPSWRAQPEAATWHWVDDHDGAAQVLADLPDVILLTVGRQPLSHYLRLGPPPGARPCGSRAGTPRESVAVETTAVPLRASATVRESSLAPPT